MNHLWWSLKIEGLPHVEAKFTTDKVQQRCHWVLFHWLCTSYLRTDTNISSTACTKFPSAEADQRCHSVFITLQLRAITVSQCRHLHSWALLQSRQLPTLIILKAAGPQTARWSNQCGQLLLLLLHSDAINRDQHQHHHQKIKPSGQRQAFGPEARGSGANQAFAMHHHQHQLRHHHHHQHQPCHHHRHHYQLRHHHHWKNAREDRELHKIIITERARSMSPTCM